MNSAYDVIVVGAGAAGLVAAAEAAGRGLAALLIEKNRRPGVKILMSGGTRCNLTHSTDKWGIIEAYGSQGNFLHSALAALSPADLVSMIEAEGVPTKVEETGKVFPVSNRAVDVLDALVRRLHASGAQLALEESVLAVERAESGFCLRTSRRELACLKVVITVGGQSYPGSGTTGDGYAWAAGFGHTIIPPRPALTPLTSSDGWVRELSGITVPDVGLELQAAGTIVDCRRGSLLFAHFGLSGPVAMDISRSVTAMSDSASARLVCDFLPALSQEQLEEALKQAAASDGKRHVGMIIAQWLPRRLVDALLGLAGLPAELRSAEFSKAARNKLVQAVKGTVVAVTGTRGFAKAEVTAGGVCLDEIDSRTMESKLVPGLYFAGEVLDLDGPIGGFNFQAAFSTGTLAGRSV